MPYYEVTITGSKTFMVEAESQDDALDNPVVADEMSFAGDIDWEADTASAKLETGFDLAACRRHKIPVFDQFGEEIEA